MEYTLLLGKYFKERFVELGGTVVMEGNYQTGDKVFSAQITKLKGQKAKPDMLYIAAGPDDVETIVKQFRDAGIKSPITGGDGYDTPLLVQVAGKGAENVYFTTHSLMDPKLGTDAVKKFIANYQAEFKVPPENAFAGLGYDTVKLLADAIKRGGSAGSQGHPQGPAGHQGSPGSHRGDQLPGGKPDSPEGSHGHPGEGRQFHPCTGSLSPEGAHALRTRSQSLSISGPQHAARIFPAWR